MLEVCENEVVKFNKLKFRRITLSSAKFRSQALDLQFSWMGTRGDRYANFGLFDQFSIF